VPFSSSLARLSADRAQALLERMHGVRVLVVGDLMLDVYLRGSASRISPEAPVPIVRIEERWRALGGAANVAANVSALGGLCSVVGAVGADEAGAALVRELDGAGIATAALLQLPDRPTTVKTRVLVRGQQVARYDDETDEDIAAAEVASASAQIRRLVAESDVVILEDYDKGFLVEPLIAASLEAARTHGRPVVVDPKSRHFHSFAGAAVLKPNLPELAAALRQRVRPADADWMAATRRELGCRNLLLTLGEEGMALATEEDELVRIPTVARSVYDVSGAGDTVIAVVALALAAGGTVVEAAVLANHAAGIEVGKAGVATVSPEELRTVLREHHEQSRLAAEAPDQEPGEGTWS
jgi:rfaE bifunctional protein kinase chain/domain